MECCSLWPAGCTAAAKYKIVILLRCESGDWTTAEVEPHLYVCEEHKSGTRAEDIVDDGAWMTFVRAFAEKGRALPCRRLTELRFDELFMMREGQA